MSLKSFLHNLNKKIKEKADAVKERVPFARKSVPFSDKTKYQRKEKNRREMGELD